MGRVSKKEKLTINPQDYAKLHKIKNSRTESKAHVERATMILMYYEGKRICEIVHHFQTNRPKVERVIKKALAFGAMAALDDLARPGKPKTITDEALSWMTSIACQKPKDLGYPEEVWSYYLLAEYLRKNCEQAGHPSLNMIQKGTISKIFATLDIKPFKIKYYVEKRDPQFDDKMVDVLHVYKQVELIKGQDEQPVAYISYDEKPGIQAIATTSPDLMPVAGKHSTISRDYEYKRLGTLSLLAGIDLVTGEITATVEDRHRSQEFITFLKKLNERYADKAKIRIILDNHSIHISKATQLYLDTVPNRFEFIFTPKHGSWLNLIESFFGKLARTLLRHIRVESVEELKQRIFAYLDRLNQDPVVYRWTYKMDEVHADE